MHTHKMMIVLVVLIALLAGLVYAAPNIFTPKTLACTTEAKLCPDGSAVGRTGPNCKFAPCPTEALCEGGACPGVATSTSGGGILPYKSGIRGTILAGPTCPVERMPPDPQCADKPVETNVSVYRTSNPTGLIATATSKPDGTFEISLPPGEYTVMAGPYGVPYPRCTNTGATVGPSSYTRVAISCDTGIR